MKLFSVKPRDFMWGCVFIVAVHLALFQVMLRTHMMEKIMATNFSLWELLLVAVFLVSRLASYLLVPPLLAALVVYVLARRKIATHE